MALAQPCQSYKVSWALYDYLQSISHWGSKFPKLGTKSKVRMKTVHKKKKKKRGAKQTGFAP
jgi:hypothetical protein